MGKKTFYKGLVLKELYFSRQCSCADLSEKLGKSFPFCLKLLCEMMQEGIIEESGFAPSSGGRRPVTYSVKADTIYIVAVAMDQMVSRISIMDFQNNNVKAVEEFVLPLYKNPSALSRLAEKMEEVIRNSGIDRKKFIGVGIGMPGFVDFKKGVNYSFFDNEEKTATQFLSEKINMPVYLDNDSSLIALAEFRFGSARHQKNAMVVNIGWGVGLGMILNGELFRGQNGFAGEFSHIPLFNNNKLCQCGKTGCLETESSLHVVLEMAEQGLKSGRLSALGKVFPTGNLEQDWKEIVIAAHKGDQLSIEILSETGYNIGKGIAILIHLLNPESVILSGRGALAGKVWLAPIQQALNEHCIPRLAANTTIGISTLGHQALLTGCAALVIEHMVKDPSRDLQAFKSKKYLSEDIK